MCHLLSEVSPSSPFMGLFSPSQSYACSTLLKTAGLAQGMGGDRATSGCSAPSCILSHPSRLPSVALKVLLHGSHCGTDTIQVRAEWPGEHG